MSRTSEPDSPAVTVAAAADSAMITAMAGISPSQIAAVAMPAMSPTRNAVLASRCQRLALGGRRRYGVSTVSTVT